jgi:hypothetical protein
MPAAEAVVVEADQQQLAVAAQAAVAQEGLLPLALLEPQTRVVVVVVADMMELIILVAAVAQAL